jgi:DNA-binding PadR family transcriptional regulator
VAKRRKVGNLMALAVLSTVAMQPMHPYEMAAVMRERGKDRDMNVKWGSLYTVVRNLEKHGFLRAVQSERQGGRPERTVYAITDAGRAEMVDWVRELVAVPEPDVPRFTAGLSLLSVLSPDEAAELLERRLRALEEKVTHGREALAATSAGIPRLFLIEFEYDLAMWAAEADWVRGLLREITDGSLPDLDRWRAFHETGELPPDLAELAGRGTDPDPE